MIDKKKRRAPRKDEEAQDESLPFILGAGGYGFTELTKPYKVSPRIEGFVRPKKAVIKTGSARVKKGRG